VNLTLTAVVDAAFSRLLDRAEGATRAA